MSKKISVLKKVSVLRKISINNERVYKNVRFSQSVCVIKELVVPINELVTKNVRVAYYFWVHNNHKLL